MPPMVKTENIPRRTHIKKVAPYPLTVLDLGNIEKYFYIIAMTFAQTLSKFAELPVEVLLRTFASDRKFGIAYIENSDPPPPPPPPPSKRLGYKELRLFLSEFLLSEQEFTGLPGFSEFFKFPFSYNNRRFLWTELDFFQK